MKALATDHLAASLIAALLAAMMGLAITRYEQRAQAGGPSLPNPLGLLVTSMFAWVALGLAILLALMTGTLWIAVLGALGTYAITRIGGLGISLRPYAALRLPLSLGALILAIALWLSALSLLEI